MCNQTTLFVTNATKTLYEILIIKYEFYFLFFTVVPQCHTQMTVKGSCAKSFKRFSYDSKERKCVPFTYSGCGGSSNRFLRRDRCEKICNKLSPKP